ncbi:MAG: hypothetical protein AABY07_02120 [Nanoarchaeota archaeon]
MTKLFPDELYEALAKAEPKESFEEFPISNIPISNIDPIKADELNETLLRIHNDIDLRRSVFRYAGEIKFTKSSRGKSHYLGIHPIEGLGVYLFDKLRSPVIRDNALCVLSRDNIPVRIADILVEKEPGISGGSVLKSLEEEIKKIISS